MENFNTNEWAGTTFGKYRRKLTFLTLLTLFFANTVQIQGQCSEITFTFDHYEPCKFRAQYENTTDCYIEIRYILEQGTFSSWTVNAAAGFTLEVISPSELWVHHTNGFMPLGNQVPLLFTLPYDLNTTIGIAYLNECAQLGCELVNIPIESCPEPQNASIIGVKYKECGSLPYINQTPISGWTIQLLDSMQNVLDELVTEVDGSYAFYDLHAGTYTVKETQQPGWTSSVPASGQTTIGLASSQQRIVNFGNCPPQPLPCTCPPGTQPDGDLVQNGSFSSTGGFSSGYTLNNNTPPLQPGQYWVGPNPSTINAGFASCGDHTGAGNMLVANGAANQSTTIWCQTMSVAPNTSYLFESWVASLSSASPANLMLFINNVSVGTGIFASNTPCTWQRYCSAWNSGTNTSVTLCLVDLNAATTGNDFAIDDISFRKCSSPIGHVTGVVYRECGTLPYIGQPVLSGWTVQLLDTMHNLISEQVTDGSGGYAFDDLPPGNYIVKTFLPGGGWTSSVPASGMIAFALNGGGTVVQNFGECPGCSCDSIDLQVLSTIWHSMDTCAYNIVVLNHGGFCFDHIDISLGSGKIASWAFMEPGWEAVLLDSIRIRLLPPGGYVPLGFSYPLKLNAIGSDEYEIAIRSFWGPTGNQVECKRTFVHQCPVPQATTDCCPAGSFPGPEKVVNGDFSAGNVNFSSEYLYYTNNPMLYGTYWVGSQPNTVNSSFQNCTDHTGGSGNMIVANGANLSHRIWRQQIPVTPNTNYSFSIWASTLSATSPAFLNLSVDGFGLGTVTLLTGAPCQWQEICRTFNSGNKTSVYLAVNNLNTNINGNDYAIDDVSLRACITPAPCVAAFTAVPLDACGHYQFTNTSTGGPPTIQYCWDFDNNPATCESTLPSPDWQFTACGTYNVSLTITGAGCSQTAYYQVVITDNVPPVAKCLPGVLNAVLLPGCYFNITPAVLNDGSTDNCKIQSLSVSPGQVNGCGDFIAALGVTDWCGNISICYRQVHPTESIPPVIVCPPNATVNCDSDLIPGPGVATATDNCFGTPSITFSDAFTGSLPCNATVTRFWQAVDGCNNQSTCMQIIKVQDNISPLIHCPADLTTDCLANLTPAQVGFPTAIDNCDHNLIVSYTDASIGQIPCNGTVIRNWTATDACNNLGACAQLITVLDIMPPTLICPQNITVLGTIGSGGCTAQVALGLPLVSDNCDPAVTLINSFNNTGDASGTYPNGPTTVVWTATDDCDNSTSCAFTVTVTCGTDCSCGAFSNLFLKINQGPSLEVTCGAAPLNIFCPPNGQDFSFSGQFLCQGVDCPTETPVSWTLINPPGSSTTVTGVPADPNFAISFPQTLFEFNGVYTLILKGHCGTQDCPPCIIKFNLDTPCLPDDCTCGSFSDIFVRTARGAPSQVISCGATPITLACPPDGGSFVLTGAYECQGTDCPSDFLMNWSLSGPSAPQAGSATVDGNLWGLSLPPTYFTQSGLYTLTLNAECGGQICPCILSFNVDCADICPCDPVDFLADLTTGFSTTIFSNTCNTCFTPINLTDCDRVEWFFDGISNGFGGGNQMFFHSFLGSGTYSVMMSVTRQKSDGTVCQFNTFSKNVTISCDNIVDCDGSILGNPKFNQGAMAGGMNSGGISQGWDGILGEPIVVEGEIGSTDGWTIQLDGNFDHSAVLTTLEPICLEKAMGTATLRYEIKDQGIKAALVVKFYRGDVLELIDCGPSICFGIEDQKWTQGLPTSQWMELQIPYDLSHWAAADSCGGNPGVLVRPAVYVFNLLGDNQGGSETNSVIAIDNFCLDGTLVALHEPLTNKSIRIFPNPNPGTFTVELREPAKLDMTFRITDLTGRLIQEQKTDPGNAKQIVRAGDLPAGLYFLQVISEGKVLATEKFVKQ